MKVSLNSKKGVNNMFTNKNNNDTIIKNYTLSETEKRDTPTMSSKTVYPSSDTEKKKETSKTDWVYEYHVGMSVPKTPKEIKPQITEELEKKRITRAAKAKTFEEVPEETVKKVSKLTEKTPDNYYDFKMSYILV